MAYLTIIKYAALCFPLIALLFTMPFILNQYHKYGAISFFKSVLLYLFIFYLICAYFLVILPLPKISDVAKMTSPRTQLIPFSFVMDFLSKSSLDIANVHTYIPAFKESYVYVPLFNVFLTVPFGMFIRYYFQCDFKKTAFFTFLLSLFFELTQLSGLYFIYPRGYRLFDVDDLILNTCGGIVGYWIAYPFIHLLPPIDHVNARSKERGKTVSGFRRTVALLLDLFILSFIESILVIQTQEHTYASIMVAIIYYFVLPMFLDTSTPGKKFLNIQVLDTHGHKNMQRLIFRKTLCLFIYILLPVMTLHVVLYTSDDYLREFMGVIVLGCLFLLDAISALKYIFTNKAMLYEKISKTRLVSTIK